MAKKSDVLDQIVHRIPGPNSNGSAEAVRVLTVRMPASLHTELRLEAQRRGISANKLAIALLSIKGPALDKLAKISESGRNGVDSKHEP